MLHLVNDELDMQTRDDGGLYLARKGKNYALSVASEGVEVEVVLDHSDLLTLAIQATAFVAVDSH